MIPGMNTMPMPNNMLESEMIGAIKIKDGLFIGDEYASTVSLEIPLTLLINFAPLRVMLWIAHLSRSDNLS